VKGLKVAGRTSSFQFKGKNEDLRTIGETLGVANIVEGSVRKQGNRVRITAQLIQAADGFHLWSHTFEGDLTNVFDLQEKIARSITNELKIVLQGDQKNRLVPVATQSPDAYALYLQATAFFNRRDGDRFPEGIAQLEQAVRLDPGFARAWSRLATLWVLTPAYRPADFDAALSAAEKTANRAIELDPSLGEPHAVLGLSYGDRHRFFESRAEFQRALDLEPDDVTTNFWFGANLVCLGYLTEGKQLLDKVLTIDPVYGNALHWRGILAFIEGDLDLAERLMARSRDAGLTHAGLGMSYVAEARGRKQEAVARLIEGLTPLARDLPEGSVEAIARGAYGDTQARERALVLVQHYLATRPKVVSGAAPYAFLRLGRPAEALEILGRGPTGNDSLPLPALWARFGREARTLPQFSEVAGKMGLVDLWEKNGPPDLCRRVEPKKYLCQ
jgi:tetratricopeptide (TPR) repeat protein